MTAMPKELQRLILTNLQAQLASVQSDIKFVKEEIETRAKDLQHYKDRQIELDKRKLMLTKALIHIEQHEVEE